MSDNGTPLEGDAGSVLWRRTLSQIPSLFGRLAWLASLRNPHTGVYEHHGLGVLFGPERASKALRLSHLACCRDWLKSSLEEQMADLRLYLSEQQQGAGEVVENWQDVDFWRTILPASIRGAERAQYMAEVGMLLSLLRNEASGGGDRQTV